MSDYYKEHLTPNEELLSYSKMVKFTNHQINLLKEEMGKIEKDTLFYVLHDEESLKNYSHYHTALDQWEFLLECLEYRYDLLTF